MFPDVTTTCNYNKHDLKEIMNVNKSRTIPNGNIVILCVKKRKTLAMICWVKDAYFCDLNCVIADFDNNAISVANPRAAIQKQMLAQA